MLRFVCQVVRGAACHAMFTTQWLFYSNLPNISKILYIQIKENKYTNKEKYIE